MTLTATYDSVLSRVQLSATGMAAADLALIERSVDTIRWTTVRGALAVPCAAGSTSVTTDDYEFQPDVLNTYRIRGRESGAIAFVAAGSAQAGNNASLTPGLPAGLLDGDLLVIFASIRNSGTGTVNVPTGWDAIKDFGNMALLGRRYVTGDVAPTVTFAGGAANADTFARMVAFRRAGLVPETTNQQLNGSSASVAFPLLNVSTDGMLILLGLWKQDDWTSVAAAAGFTEAFEQTAATGDDASQALDYMIQTTATNVSAGSAAVTGGGSAISRAALAAMPHAEYLNEQSATITPELSTIWLKSIARPFLNHTVTVTGWSDPVRVARRGLFAVKGRSNPVAVNDVRGSKEFDLQVMQPTRLDSDDFDVMMSAGDVWLIHKPADCPVPGGYVSIGDTTEAKHTPRATRRFWTLPCVIVDAPAADVVGATITCQGVLNAYATCADLLADNATCLELMTLIGDPTDVIVA